MSEVRKIAHNTLIQLIGKATTVAIGLLAFSLIARSLGQAGFGQFSTVYAYLSIFAIVIDWGLQMTVAKLISDPRNDQDKILSNALTMRLVGSGIFLTIAPIIVWWFPYPQIVKVGVAIAAAGFIFTSMLGTLTSLFQKNLKMHHVVMADIIAKIIYIGLVVAVFVTNAGLLGFIAATVCDGIVTFFVLLYFAKRSANIKPAFEWAIWRLIFRNTWPIAATIALNLLYFKGDTVILSLLRSEAEVGLYGMPYRVLEVLINVVYIFLGLILPLMAAAIAANNLPRLKNILQSTFDFLIMVSVPLIIGGYFLGRPMVILLAGEEFAVSGDIIKILLLATVAVFIAALFGYAVVALDKQKSMIKFYAINAIVSLIAYFIFIPIYGYWAAAWITVASELFILCTALYVVHAATAFLPRLRIVGKSLLASIVMAVPLFLFNQVNVVMLFLAGVIIYGIVLYLLKGFDKETVKEIMQLKRT